MNLISGPEIDDSESSSESHEEEHGEDLQGTYAPGCESLKRACPRNNKPSNFEGKQGPEVKL
jgi:hypothetical protein